jgi:hypothetical protein
LVFDRDVDSQKEGMDEFRQKDEVGPKVDAGGTLYRLDDCFDLLVY